MRIRVVFLFALPIYHSSQSGNLILQWNTHDKSLCIITMKILIGTSGWQYSDWVGTFYKKGLKAKQKLEYFASRFPTVEINSSFYRLPTAKTFKTWYDNAPEGFIYSVKFPRYVTQMKKLIVDEDSKPFIKDFLDNSKNLKEKLGCVLIQMPPSFKCDAERIKKFLKYLFAYAKKIKYKADFAMEFRNSECFNESVYKILNKYKIAFVISQTSKWPLSETITADTCYIRFHGPTILFNSSYSEQEMQKWAKFIESHQEVKKFYVYFNNTMNRHAIGNAEYLMKLLKIQNLP